MPRARRIHDYSGYRGLKLEDEALDENAPALPLKDMLQKNAVFHPYSLFNDVEDPDICARAKAFVYDGLARGRIRPRIGGVYPMKQDVEAFEYLSPPRKNHGKVVVTTGL
jgi:NADPH:quinone reductase-like Zn-dependent oxidoreductase